jgi:hypothetical protein
VLKLRDAETGRDEPVGARGAARVRVAEQDPDAETPLTRLRALLAADVLRRIADVAGVRVLVEADDDMPGRAGCGIAPADADPGTFGDRADVVITPGPPNGGGGVRVSIADLIIADAPNAVPNDLLALRLAILSVPYARPARIGPDDVRDAEAELARWRGRVAEWAEGPSRPMCADYVAKFRGAFEDDLDIPAALAVLRLVEDDPDLPPGAKFETFVFADRVLALELPRDIGRAPGA